MSKVTFGAFRSRPVAADEREALFGQVIALDTAMGRNSQTVNRLGFYFGASGLAVGVAGLIGMAVMLPLKTHEVRVALFDATTHTPLDSVAANKAPDTIYNAQTAAFELRRLVIAAQSWSSDGVAERFKLFSVLATRDQQAAQQERLSPKNPQSPQVLYGNRSSIDISDMRFSPVAGDGTGLAPQIWQVRFTAVESRKDGQQPGPPQKLVAWVTFAWHPELIMRADDETRSMNLTGFQMSSYSVGRL